MKNEAFFILPIFLCVLCSFPYMCHAWLRHVYKVETPIHDSIRELVTWECKEHGVNIVNVLANPKGKCWALELEFLEA
jgi:hypothetical protein